MILCKYEIAKISINTLTKDWLNSWAKQEWKLFQIIPYGTKLVVIFKKDLDTEYEGD